MTPPNRPPQPTFPTTPTSRAYVHRVCGQTTLVDGDDFQGLCNPFVGILPATTFCTTCARQGPLTEFAWADTNETLESYRQRLRTHVVSRGARFGIPLFRKICLIGFPLMGLAFGQRHGGPGSILWPTLGVIVGFVLGVVVVGVQMAVDKRDYRMYR